MPPSSLFNPDTAAHGSHPLSEAAAGLAEPAVLSPASPPALASWEQSLLSILQNINDPFAILDTRWRFIHVNESYLELTSRNRLQPVTRRELIGCRLWEKFPKLIGSEVARFYHRVMASQRAGVLEVYHQRLQAWLELRAFPSHEHILIYLRDVTDRRQASDLLRKNIQRAQLLSETLGQLLRAANPQEVIDEFFPKVLSFLGLDLFFNYTVGKSGDVLELRAWGGASNSNKEPLRTLPFGVGLCGVAAQTREMVLANNIMEADPATWRHQEESAEAEENLRLLKDLGVLCHASYPLLVSGRLLGTLSFSSLRRPFFDDADLRFLKEVAQYAAIALDRVRTETLARQQRHVLQLIAEGAPLKKTLETLLEMVEAESEETVFGSILVLDENGKMFQQSISPSLPAAYSEGIVGHMIGPTAGSCGSAASRGKPVYVSDIASDPLWACHKHEALAHGLRACWSTPIFSSNGQVLGTFAMYYPQPRHPRDEDMHIVHMAARTASVAIERNRRERELRESEARFRNMADNAPVMVWMSESDGACTFLSKSWHDFTGQPLQEGLGMGWLNVIHPDDRGLAEKEFRTGLHEQRAYRVEYRLWHRSGTYRWVLAAATPRISTDNSLFLGYIGSVIDIAEHKTMEAELRQARDRAELANKAKDRILAVLSHELRTPLAPVLMSVGAMENNEELPAEVRDDAAMIRRNVMLETKLIDDLLDHSSIRNGKLHLRAEAFDLQRSITETCEMCADQLGLKKLALEIRLDSSIQTLWGDAARLQQVWWNILKNAIKFTPAEGVIRISSQRRANIVRIVFEDNGAGIRADFLPRVFNAFEQADVLATGGQPPDGLGLGLSISKAIVELHQGHIFASSLGLGRGSQFTVELPLRQSSPARLIPSAASEENRAICIEGVRLLLVEDDKDTVRVLKKLLERDGCRVLATPSHEEALRLAEANVFDIVVSDLGLPDGDGWNLMRLLRERHGLKGIAVSGYGMVEDIRKCHEAGFTESLVKPLLYGDLRQAIARQACRDAG